MTTLGYGIQGLSPLGTYGLGATGGYGSYDMYMPSAYMSGMGAGINPMMGMMDPSIFGMGAYGMGGYGMNAMLQYPLLYGKMQAEMEKNQLNHAIYMQDAVNQYGVSATESADRSLFHKLGVNGQIQLGIENLYRKVTEGDQRGIQDQFDELRNYILQTYGDEFKKLGTEANPIATANQFIKQAYAQSVQAMTGQPASFEDDVVKYGRKAFGAGFRQGYRNGSSGIYVDETIQHCLGRGIDEKGAKDRARNRGRRIGYIANNFENGAYGAILGAAGGATIGAIAKGLALKKAGTNAAKLAAAKALPRKGTKFGVLIGAALGIAYSIYEICTRKSDKAAA